MKYLRLEKDNGIATLTISRPEALNALNVELLKECETLLNNVTADRDIRVLIVTGEGKAFVAGADIKEMSCFTAEEGRRFAQMGQSVFSKLENLHFPTIAAINGFALGGGCELALSCDIRIASERAKLGQPEVTLGITPGFGGTQRLTKVVGVAKAKELIYTGKVIDAKEALAIGLVNHVAEDCLALAMDMAKAIAKVAPLAVQYSKNAIDTGLTQTVEAGCHYESNVFGLCFATQDQKTGMQAFIEKEKPVFQGN